MAVSQTLLDQLTELDDKQRLEVAQLLLATVDRDDDLEDADRERLHAALDRSLEDIKAGRLHDARHVIEQLGVRHRP